MQTFNKAPVAIAVTALFASGAALANGIPGYSGYSASSSIESTAVNDKEVSIQHDADFSSDIEVEGGLYLNDLERYAGAVTDSKQLNEGNLVNNGSTDNNGNISGGAFQGSSGNIGANVAGGDNNQQANDAALSAADANQVFARSSNFSFQSSSGNGVNNIDTTNSAGVSGGAFQDAAGNIAVNAAAGTGNGQQNAFSAADSNEGSADATSAGVQQSYGNMTANGMAEVSVELPYQGELTFGGPTENKAYLSGSAFQDASGNISANAASGSGNMQRNSLAVAGTE